MVDTVKSQESGGRRGRANLTEAIRLGSHFTGIGPSRHQPLPRWILLDYEDRYFYFQDLPTRLSRGVLKELFMNPGTYVP